MVYGDEFVLTKRSMEPPRLMLVNDAYPSISPFQAGF